MHVRLVIRRLRLDPCHVGYILSWRLILKYFLWSFSPFHRFKKGRFYFLVKACAQCWLINCFENNPVKVWLGKLTTLEMNPVGCLSCITSTQTIVTSKIVPYCIQSLPIKSIDPSSQMQLLRHKTRKMLPL